MDHRHLYSPDHQHSAEESNYDWTEKQDAASLLPKDEEYSDSEETPVLSNRAHEQIPSLLQDDVYIGSDDDNDDDDVEKLLQSASSFLDKNKKESKIAHEQIPSLLKDDVDIGSDNDDDID
eukprot:3265005-Ditylum_brightwellii.AAC.1